jgi:hypothetical protein
MLIFVACIQAYIDKLACAGYLVNLFENDVKEGRTEGL